MDFSIDDDLIIAENLYNENRYEEAGYFYLKSIASGVTNPYPILMSAYLFYRFGQRENFNNIMRYLRSIKFPTHIGLYRHLMVLQSGIYHPDDISNKGFFTEDDIVQIYKTYLHEIKSNDLHNEKDLFENSITSHLDYDMLFFITRLLKPRHVLEFSPKHGLSTIFILKALMLNNKDFTFATFDIIDSPEFYQRMDRFNMNLRITVGDAIVTIPQYLREKGLLRQIDLCFIDSEHTYDFAQKYTKKILPLLGENTTLIVHDMCYCPRYPQKNINHYGESCAKNICGHINSYGEAEYLGRFFHEIKGYRIFLTHRLFGGFGLLSPKIEKNLPLIDRLKREVEGFIYKTFKGQFHEDRKIPCLLIAI
ncbi:MAG: class I SAM-dependent methyltransferase, partial [Thermodesulfovibrionales bacterium]